MNATELKMISEVGCDSRELGNESRVGDDGVGVRRRIKHTGVR